MTGWRAYALGAFTGIAAWSVLNGVVVLVVDWRRGDRKPLGDYFEGVVVGVAAGAGVALFVGVGLEALD